MGFEEEFKGMIGREDDTIIELVGDHRCFGTPHFGQKYPTMGPYYSLC